MIRAGAALVALALSASASLAACTAAEIGAITFSGTSVPPYNPFVTPTPRLVTVNVTSTVTCSVEVAFQASSNPSQMLGPGTLIYDVQLPATATSLLFVSGTPSSTTRIDIAAGNIGSATVQVVLPPNQVVSAGAYGDTSLVAHVYDKSGSVLTLLKSANVPITGSVAAACQFVSPTNPSIDFSSAITNGMPRPNYIGTVTLPTLSCTAPSLVRLSAGPMLRTPSASGAGFDNLINFRATASLEGATANLDTSTGTAVASTQRNVASGTTINSSVRVDVSLIAGRPLLAGTYSSLLTLSIDPNP